MKVPDFSIGQAVAVTSSDAGGWTVIPNTEVIEMRYHDGATTIMTGEGRRVPLKGWWYCVAAQPGRFYAEPYLRAIDPDDYTDVEETEELTVS